MSLAQFLSQLGGAQMPPTMMQPTMGGFGGGTFGMDGKQVTPMQQLTGMVQTPPDFMQQVERSQQMPREMPKSPTSKFTGIRDVFGQIGDYLLQANDMQPLYAPKKAEYQKQQASEALSQYLGRFDPALADLARADRSAGMDAFKMNREADRDLQRRQQAVEDRDWKASQPDYFTVGRDRVKLDRSTGEAQVVYDGPADFDEYATSLGIEPGTDEYKSAVLDYVLRGSGPTALDNDRRLDDHRTSNRAKVRGTPTYRDKNPPPPRTSARKPAAPPVVAVNPKTGEKRILDSRGEWVPMK